MKKEIAAWVLITVITSASVLSGRYVQSMSEELSGFAEAAVVCAESGDWDACEKNAEAAVKLWRENDTYTHIIFHHSEIDSVTDAICGLLSAAYSQEPGDVRSSAAAAVAHFKSISDLEGIKLGSIF